MIAAHSHSLVGQFGICASPYIAMIEINYGRDKSGRAIPTFLKSRGELRFAIPTFLKSRVGSRFAIPKSG